MAIAGLCRVIDFSQRVLLHEAAIIGLMTKGTFTYQVIRDLPWPDYEELNREVPKTIAKAYKAPREDGSAS